MTRAYALALLLPVVVLGLAGVAGGAVWAWWADPPALSDVTETNGDLLLGVSFGVEMRYAAVATLLGLLAGGSVTVPLRRVGWPVAVGTALGGLLAALVSYRLGRTWGPPPEPGLAGTDVLSGALAIHAPGFFLTWPVAAVAGCWLVAWSLDRDPVPAGADLPELDRRGRTNG